MPIEILINVSGRDGEGGQQKVTKLLSQLGTHFALNLSLHLPIN